MLMRRLYGKYMEYNTVQAYDSDLFDSNEMRWKHDLLYETQYLVKNSLTGEVWCLQFVLDGQRKNKVTGRAINKI